MRRPPLIRGVSESRCPIICLVNESGTLAMMSDTNHRRGGVTGRRLGPRTFSPCLPTPLHRLSSPVQPDIFERVWIKRDDLTGPVGGGNKARKLWYLTGDALNSGADAVVTVGAAQSNHCRMTAAVGVPNGLDVHLVLAGDRPSRLEGNQLLAELLGAQLHFTGTDDRHWGELAVAADALVDELGADGLTPYLIPIGGSTPIGALGYVEAFDELMVQCAESDISPAAIVVTSSSGGTHAGLLAGRAAWRAAGRPVPEIVAIGVAKGVIAGMPDVAELANATLRQADLDGEVNADDVVIDDRWIGDDYARPTPEGDSAVRRGARECGMVFDRTYTGKGFAGLLGNLGDGRWDNDRPVVFIHTGGGPSVFASGGLPADPAG